jgi:hypothetical protein
MRVFMAFLSCAVLACSAFAWSELRQLRAHDSTPVSAVEEERELIPAIDHKPNEEPRAEPAPAAASTWHGQLPFGGVPGAEPPAVEDGPVDVVGTTDDVVVSDPVVEAPVTGEFAAEDNDGRLIEVTPQRFIFDHEGRRITLERSEIIIY